MTRYRQASPASEGLILKPLALDLKSFLTAVPNGKLAQCWELEERDNIERLVSLFLQQSGQKGKTYFSSPFFQLYSFFFCYKSPVVKEQKSKERLWLRGFGWDELVALPGSGLVAGVTPGLFAHTFDLCARPTAASTCFTALQLFPLICNNTGILAEHPTDF